MKLQFNVSSLAGRQLYHPEQASAAVFSSSTNVAGPGSETNGAGGRKDGVAFTLFIYCYIKSQHFAKQQIMMITAKHQLAVQRN
ncbi:hypothetical protein OH492_12905 [Vibrio chagasii]|nr:hypothetical protein [Vibrio chagasii]